MSTKQHLHPVCVDVATSHTTCRALHENEHRFDKGFLSVSEELQKKEGRIFKHG